MATNNIDKMKKPYPTVGKIYWRIPLRLETPVIIGSGESERSDVDVLREPVLWMLPNETASRLKKFGKTPTGISPPGGTPLIPATSLIGVFRAYLETQLENVSERDLKANFDYLFGGRQGKKQKTERPPQSALQCDDVLLWSCQTKIRDGVAIDHKTNRADDKKKFAYEIIEPGQSFDLNLEITLRSGWNGDKNRHDFHKLIQTIIQGIVDERIRLGAKTNKGFGRLTVDAASIQSAELNFDEKNDVYAWLSGELENSYKEFKLDPKTLLAIPQKSFKIDAWFKIKNSLLIKSYSADPEQPDAVPLKSNDDYVMPGTSVMGAVRHRALKILRTLRVNDEKVENLADELFGFVREKKNDAEKRQHKPNRLKDENDSEKLAQKGRLLVEETILGNVVPAVQTRIKIDRFTGGTIHGALFEMMPLWQSGNGQAVNIVMSLNREYKDWEAGLLLFVLKDLWTGDLPIGGEKNVGRGVLQGINAKIEWQDQGGPHTVELKSDANGRLVKPEDFNMLEKFAAKLQEEIRHAKSN